MQLMQGNSKLDLKLRAQHLPIAPGNYSRESTVLWRLAWDAEKDREDQQEVGRCGDVRGPGDGDRDITAGFFIAPAALLPDSKPRNESSSSGVSSRKPVAFGAK